MFTGKLLRQAIDKFLKGEVAGNARVQVVLPNGEFYDIVGIDLMEERTRSATKGMNCQQSTNTTV